MLGYFLQKIYIFILFDSTNITLTQARMITHTVWLSHEMDPGSQEVEKKIDDVSGLTRRFWMDIVETERNAGKACV